MKKLLATIALLLAGNVFAADVEFIAPLPGAQAIGVQVIEVKTAIAGVNRVEFFVDGAMAGVSRQAPWRIAYDFGTTTTARTVTAKIWSDNYRKVDTANVLTSALATGQTIDVDLVEVPMRIRSRNPVRAADLRIRENGKEQVVRDVLQQRGPAHFAFVVDRSLSMGDGRLAATLAAIDSVRPMLRAGDTASIVFFNHNVSKPEALAPDVRVATRFANLVPSGGTSLRDALVSAVSAGRTYAIVVTDGGDRNSELAEARALERISGTKTVVDAVVLGNASAFLERATAMTGGTLLRAGHSTIASQLQRIVSDINSRYTAVYQSAGGTRGWRTITVAPRRGGVDIASARKGYFAR